MTQQNAALVEESRRGRRQPAAAGRASWPASSPPSRSARRPERPAQRPAPRRTRRWRPPLGGSAPAPPDPATALAWRAGDVRLDAGHACRRPPAARAHPARPWVALPTRRVRARSESVRSLNRAHPGRPPPRPSARCHLRPRRFAAAGRGDRRRGTTMGAQEGLIENLTYDELRLGQRAQMLRTLSMDDINAFALVSGDVNPAHVDAAVRRGRPASSGVVAPRHVGRRRSISSVLGTEFPGPGTIYVEPDLALRPARCASATRSPSPSPCRQKFDAQPPHRLRLQGVLNQEGEQVRRRRAPRCCAPTREDRRARA
ncbi:MAG: hypothetical protein MZW92_20930 [Comamonadaceae bacterium]|nr:hypothetical protein [Comamonadaceae bacterium]